MAISNHKGPYL